MKRSTPIAFALLFAFCLGVSAQVPMSIKVQIAQAEDPRRYDAVLENLMKSPNADVRAAAALAAGRIGREEALPTLISRLVSDVSEEVRKMAAFALGEIESTKAADAISAALKAETRPVGSVPRVTARLIEAAGKIAAANPTDPKAKELGRTIVDTLEAENAKGARQDREIVLLALTAALRARPENADKTVAKFLTNPDERIRADAANTLARLRAKNANDALRAMLKDIDPIARGNAARALGAAEDKGAADLLLTAATDDTDSRVRVSAIRALAVIRDAKTAPKLLERGEILLNKHNESKLAKPIEQGELLEIAIALGRILPNTDNKNTTFFLNKLLTAVNYKSGEVGVALVRISVVEWMNSLSLTEGEVKLDWHLLSVMVQGLGEIASVDNTEGNKQIKGMAVGDLRDYLNEFLDPKSAKDIASTGLAPAIPGTLRAFAAFKPNDLDTFLRRALIQEDPFVRSTAADLLADQPKSKENVDALKMAFTKALLTDKVYNDAQFSILDALFKLDKKESVGMLLVALNAPDYLLRKKAFQMLADKHLQKDCPGIATSLENARKAGKDRVLPYNPAFGTKLGQVLNTRADYVRALSRKNGSVKAVLTTEKGTFTLDFYPEEAPLTVDNFIKLARSGYFNGVEVHRVVPNFVMQDGDPRGDGNGGPGWSIRCEVNMLMYERGMVGMALSGKDTGGSQWFVTHSPQPHLDGGYTIFGRVNEKDMKVVDNIVRGDKILTVRIIGR